MRIKKLTSERVFLFIYFLFISFLWRLMGRCVTYAFFTVSGGFWVRIGLELLNEKALKSLKFLGLLAQEPWVLKTNFGIVWESNQLHNY